MNFCRCQDNLKHLKRIHIPLLEVSTASRYVVNKLSMLQTHYSNSLLDAVRCSQRVPYNIGSTHIENYRIIIVLCPNTAPSVSRKLQATRQLAHVSQLYHTQDAYQFVQLELLALPDINNLLQVVNYQYPVFLYSVSGRHQGSQKGLPGHSDPV